MSLSYCVHFIRDAQHPEVVRERFKQTLYTPDNSAWLTGNFAGVNNDRVYEAGCSIIQAFSEQAGAEIVFIFVDGMTDMFRYEHAKDGVLLRKLLYLSDSMAARWLAVEGTPEAWEDEIIFSDWGLRFALDSGFIQCDIHSGEERHPEAAEQFKEEVRQLYRDKRFLLNDIWPRCDVEGLALGIQRHYGMVLPPRRGWSAET